MAVAHRSWAPQELPEADALTKSQPAAQPKTSSDLLFELRQAQAKPKQARLPCEEGRSKRPLFLHHLKHNSSSCVEPQQPTLSRGGAAGGTAHADTRTHRHCSSTQAPQRTYSAWPATRPLSSLAAALRCQRSYLCSR